MRIVHVTSGFLGYGLSHKEQMLATAQVAQGHEVTILAAQIGPSSWVDAIQKIDPTRDHAHALRREEQHLDGLHILRLRPLWHYADLYWCQGVREAVSRIPADLWHLHEPAHGLPAQVAIEVSAHTPVVIDQHQYTISFTGKPLVELEYRLVRQHIVNLAYRQFDAIVSPTNGGARFLAQRHGIDPSRVTVIPLAVRTDIFHPDPIARIRRRSELGFSDQDIVLVMSGNLQPFKRHVDVIRGLHSAVARAPQLRLLLIGSGQEQYLHYLQKTAARMGLESHITWLPLTTEAALAEYFAASDAATWPLFPTISMSQAVACGLALIISTHPSQSQYLDIGCGLGFPPNDIAGMADCFVEIANNPEVRRKLSAHNQRVGADALSSQAIAQRYSSVYQEALQRFSARSTKR